MSIESEQDLAGLRRVGALVAAVLRHLESIIAPGMTTAELDATAESLLDRAGARATPRHVYQFPGSLCINVNDEAVHGIPSSRVLRTGDLVKLDLTADLNGYVADAAITVALSKASRIHLQLRDCAKSALSQGIAAAVAGRAVREIGKAVHHEVRRHGFSVIPQLCGHGVGRAIHEPPNVPNYDEPAAFQPLTNGLVLTIEPIISAGVGRVTTAADGWTMKTVDGKSAAHYEHTIVITRSRPIVLTA